MKSTKQFLSAFLAVSFALVFILAAFLRMDSAAAPGNVFPILFDNMGQRYGLGPVTVPPFTLPPYTNLAGYWWRTGSGVDVHNYSHRDPVTGTQRGLFSCREGALTSAPNRALYVGDATPLNGELGGWEAVSIQVVESIQGNSNPRATIVFGDSFNLRFHETNFCIGSANNTGGDNQQDTDGAWNVIAWDVNTFNETFGSSNSTTTVRGKDNLILQTTSSTGVILTTNFVQLAAGRKYLAGDQQNITATYASINNMTVNVINGRNYTFQLVVFCSDSVAADAVKLDFAGGTATTSDYRAEHSPDGTVVTGGTAQTTSRVTSVPQTMAGTGNGMIKVNGSFTASSTGTFIPRMAQQAHSSGTLTVFRGSHLWIDDTQ